MVDKRVVNYIKDAKAKGYSEESLSKALLKQGRDPKKIKEAMNLADNIQPKTSSASQPETSPTPKPKTPTASQPETSSTPKPKTSTVSQYENSSTPKPKTSHKKFIIIGAIALFLIIALSAAAFLLLNNPACTQDSECNDNDETTKDICTNPSEKTAKCINTKEVEANNTEEAPAPEEADQTPEGVGELTLGIISSKDTYEIGEEVSGEFKILYTGESFEGVVLYFKSKEGIAKKYYSSLRGNISSGENDILKNSFQAFKLNNSEYSNGLNYFHEEGNYVYEIAVYHCETITSNLAEDCSSAESKDIAGLTPLKSTTKIIKVQNGTLYQ